MRKANADPQLAGLQGAIAVNRIYRIVFNRTLGVLQVASELASSPKGGTADGAGVVSKPQPTSRVLAIAVSMALAAVASPAWSQTCVPSASVICGVAGGNGGNGTTSDQAGGGGTGAVTSGPYVNNGGSGGTSDGAGAAGQGASGTGGAGGPENLPGGAGTGGGLLALGNGGGGGGGGAFHRSSGGKYDFGGGGGGGGGGVGQSISGSSFVNPGSIIGGRGGSGGNGGFSGTSGYGGGGGGGGAGVYATSGSTITSASGSTITGGVGGNGGGGYKGAAGAGGGAGVAGNGFTLGNGGTITGGNGGNGGGQLSDGGIGGNGGSGGAGVIGSSLTITNSGRIVGGNGGAGASDTVRNGSSGAGGVGVVVTGNSTITNSGTIAGGTGVNGQADAIDLSGGANTLVLQAGSAITGNVVSSSGNTSGGDTLVLGGGTNSSFAASQIGSQYQGFAQYEKLGTSTWTLTGATAATTPWTLIAGTLAISNDASLGASAGKLTFNGGTLEATATISTNRAMVLSGAGDIDVDAGMTLTANGVLSGAGPLTKGGSGALTLTGHDTYTGDTTINGGTLSVTSGGGITSTAHVFDNGTLVLDGAGTSLATTAAAGSGATVLVGNNGNGSLQLSNGASLTSSSEVDLGNGAGDAGVGSVTGGATLRGYTSINVGQWGTGTLTVSGGGTVTASGFLSIADETGSTGNTTVTGSGSSANADWVAVGNHDGTGTLTIANGGTVNANHFVIGADAGSVGTVNIGAAAGDAPAAAGTLNTSSVAFGNGSGSLVFNHTDTGYVFAPAISGAGNVDVLAGTTIFTANDSYSGSTTITGGTLSITSGSSVANTSTVLDNGTLNVDGVGSGITATSGGTPFLVGSNGTGTLTASNGASVQSNGEINIGQSGGDVGSVTVTSGASMNAGASINIGKWGDGTLDVSGGGTVTANGFFSIADQSTATGVVTVTDSGSSVTATQEVAVGNHGGNGTLTVANGAQVSSPIIVIAGDAGSVGVLNIGAAAGNAPTAAGTLNTGNVAFGNGSGSLVFNHTDTGYVFAPTISGAGNVDVLAGTTIFTADNSYTGSTQINGGILQLSGTGAIASSSDVTVTSGTFDISGLTTGGTTINDLAGAGNVNLGGNALTLGTANNTEFDGVIADGGNAGGSGGSLIKQGAGTLTLTGSNTYTGATTISGGTLALSGTGSIASSSGVIDNGTLDISGVTTLQTTIGDLSGTGTVSLGGNTLKLGTANSTEFDGVISDGSSGIGGALIKQGSGTLTLTGSNTYTGATTISSGTLALSGAGSIASSSSVIDNASLDISGLSNGGTTISDLTGAGTVYLGSNTLTLGTANNTQFDGVMADGGSAEGSGGSVIKQGTGTLTLTGNNTYTGTTTVAGGTLQLAVGASIAGNVNVQNGTSLGGAGTIAGNVDLASGATLASSGTLTLGSLVAEQGSQLNVSLGAPGADFHSFGTSTSVAVTGNLELDGATVNVANAGNMGPGLYNLFTYGGSLTENNGGLSLGATPAGGVFTIQNLTADKQINLLNTAGLTLSFWNANGQATASQLGGGSGTWSVTSQTWTDANADATAPMQPQPSFGIFGGASGTVTIDNSAGAVQATGLQFASNGYVLTGDTLTLVSGNGSAPVISVGDGSSGSASWVAMLDNTLVSDVGLNKTEAGTLILAGSNTQINGGLTVSGGELDVTGNGSSLNGGVAMASGTTLVTGASGVDVQVTGTNGINGSGGASGNAMTAPTAGGAGSAGGAAVSGAGFTLSNQGNINGGRGGIGGTGGKYWGSPMGASAATGNGGAGAAGGAAVSGAGFSLNNLGQITGGRGGVGGAGGKYWGGPALLAVNSSLVGSTGNTTAGTGGTGGIGGQGGAGVYATGLSSLVNSGSITGGYGGNGGTGTNGGNGGHGGTGGEGGAGVTGSGFTLTNNQSIVGGVGGLGGNGGQSSAASGTAGNGGNGGAGGVGVTGADFTLTNTGTIAGGDGGAAGTQGAASNGGTAGVDGIGGAGGVGVVSTGGSTIINAGQIISGKSTDGVQADAMDLSGGGNTLVVEAGYAFTGNVVSTSGSTNGGDTLTLGGSNNASFNVSTLGAVGSSATIQGFAHLDKSGTSTWTLTGTGNASQAWTITNGTLVGTSTSIVGNVAFSPVSGGSASLTFDQSSDGTYNGAISGNGSLTKACSGALTLTGTGNASQTWTITNGALIGNSTSIVGNVTFSPVSGGSTNLTFDQSSDGVYNGVISGNGSLSKAGSGALTLTGPGNASQAWTIGNGSLIGNTASIVGNVTFSPVSGGSANLTFDQSTNGVYNGVISGRGSLTKTGSGALTLTSAGNANESWTIANGMLIGNSTSIVGNVAFSPLSGGSTSLTFNQSSDGVYNGVISGKGSLNKTGSAALTLTGPGNANQAWTITNGTLVGTSTSIVGNVTFAPVSGGSADLTFNQSTNGVYNGVISGNGSLTKTGSGTLTLTANNTYTGGTIVTGGMLQIANNDTAGMVSGNVANNGVMAFDRSDSVTYGATISGTGSVSQVGSGTLILNGVNTYTGSTTVKTGMLEVGDSAHSNASITSNVTVDAGGTLRGHGSIDGNVISDGTVWPGGSVGVLTINGNYTQNADATLQVDVTPTQASELVVNGNASLAGTLHLIYAPGTYTTTSYTLVQATSLSGTFSTTTATGVPVGLDTRVVYTPTQADLAVMQRIVAPADGALYANLLQSTSLIGQQSLSTVLGATLRSGDIACNGSNAAHANTVASSCNSDLWVQYSGGNQSISGNNGLNSSVFGLQAGVDHAVNDVLHLGVEAGFSRINSSGHQGSNANVDSVHGGVYAYANVGPVVLSGMLDETHSSFDVYRQTGIGRSVAHPDGDTTSAALQAAWPIAAAQWQVTPAVGALYQHQSLSSFSESLASTNPFANDFVLQGAHSTYTTLQPYARVQFARSFVAQGISYVPQFDVGYRYNARGGNAVVQATSQDGTAFAMPGASLGGGMATVGARITAQAGASWSLYLDYQGQFANHVNDNALSVGFTKKF